MLKKITLSSLYLLIFVNSISAFDDFSKMEQHIRDIFFQSSKNLQENFLSSNFSSNNNSFSLTYNPETQTLDCVLPVAIKAEDVHYIFHESRSGGYVRITIQKENFTMNVKIHPHKYHFSSSLGEKVEEGDDKKVTAVSYSSNSYSKMLPYEIDFSKIQIDVASLENNSSSVKFLLPASENKKKFTIPVNQK